MELFIKYGADVNSQNLQDSYQNTPIHIAIANENFSGLSHIMTLTKKYNKTINYNMKDSEGKTPLILATKMHFNEAAQLLLNEANGANMDVNLADAEGNTALHYACALGNMDLITALIKVGANVNAENKKGRTPIDMTLSSKDEIDAILSSVSIASSRDKDAKYNHFHDKSFNPLIPLTTKKAVDILTKKSSVKELQKLLSKQLLDTAAMTQFTPETIDRNNLPTMSEDEKAYIFEQAKNLSGESLLDSCFSKQTETIEHMLKLGANAAWLLRYTSASGQKNLVEKILSVQPHVINEPGKPSLNTALHYACEKGHINLALILLNLGADPSIKNKNGDTPLQLLNKVPTSLAGQESRKALQERLVQGMQQPVESLTKQFEKVL